MDDLQRYEHEHAFDEPPFDWDRYREIRELEEQRKWEREQDDSD